MSAEIRLYQPSNGTEGEGFICRFCMECERDRAFWDETGDGCDIVARSMAFKPGDADYPNEWRYDAKGEPTCTAFVPLGNPVPTEREQEEAGQSTLFGEA
jgi:hypothetical protein